MIVLLAPPVWIATELLSTDDALIAVIVWVFVFGILPPFAAALAAWFIYR